MSNEVPIQSILKVEFKAYDKQSKEYFEDTTVEQACNLIWRTICHTAEIKSITEFVVSDAPPKKHYGFKKKLTDEELQKILKT